MPAPSLAELRRLCSEASSVLERVGPIVDVGGSSVLFVGDTHGYPEVTRWALSLADEVGAEAIVFLGDYVDRGPRQLENLATVLEALLSEPSRVVPLRGNHESPEMNLYYGLAEEIKAEYGAASSDAWEALEQLYVRLPYVAVWGEVVALHGGVPCRRCGLSEEPPLARSEVEEHLTRVWGVREGLAPLDEVAMQLLWNDPRGTIDWFLPSPRGPGVYLYGRLAWRRFLEAWSARLLVRAHEAVDAAHVWLASGEQLYPLPSGWEAGLGELEYSVITVFSSLYHGAGAGALLVESTEGELRVRLYRYGGGEPRPVEPVGGGRLPG